MVAAGILPAGPRGLPAAGFSRGFQQSRKHEPAAGSRRGLAGWKPAATGRAALIRRWESMTTIHCRFRVASLSYVGQIRTHEQVAVNRRRGGRAIFVSADL